MTVLRLYTPSTSHSSAHSSAPVNPDRCPVEQADRSNSRWVRYAQCERKWKADKVRPLYDIWNRKDVELPVCGVHAGVHDRSVKKDQETRAARDKADVTKDNAEAACARLRTEYGIDASVHYTTSFRAGGGGYTGKITVDPEDLFRLLEEKS